MHKISKTLKIKDKHETEQFALKLAASLKAGDVICLVGDLGTGKTTLTGYIAKGLGIDKHISSPTFTIIKEYYGGRLPLFHFDIYRLNDGDELLDIGAEEYFYGNGVCVVEWANRALDVMPPESIIIEIEFGESETERIYTCTFWE